MIYQLEKRCCLKCNEWRIQKHIESKNCCRHKYAKTSSELSPFKTQFYQNSSEDSNKHCYNIGPIAWDGKISGFKWNQERNVLCQPCEVCQMLWICVVHPGPLLIPSETQRHLHLKINMNKQNGLILFIVLSQKQDNTLDVFKLAYHPQKKSIHQKYFVY